MGMERNLKRSNKRNFYLSKGSREKYNYSKGFLRKMEKHSIKNESGRIAAYDNYKNMFEACDKYNMYPPEYF